MTVSSREAAITSGQKIPSCIASLYIISYYVFNSQVERLQLQVKSQPSAATATTKFDYIKSSFPSPGAAEKVSNFSKSIFGNKKDNEKKAAEGAARVKTAEKLEGERLLEVTDHESHDLPHSLSAGGGVSPSLPHFL